MDQRDGKFSQGYQGDHFLCFRSHLHLQWYVQAVRTWPSQWPRWWNHESKQRYVLIWEYTKSYCHDMLWTRCDVLWPHSYSWPNADYSISKSDFHAKGYWSITKALVEKTYDNFKAQARTTTNATTFILSGHSAGGTRAALASMYMKKMKSVTIPTVTFAATGSQCPPRDLHSGKNLLDEVDPYISHSQITEYVPNPVHIPKNVCLYAHYPQMWSNIDALADMKHADVCFFCFLPRRYVHVLDPWGQALGYDNGRVCRYVD